MSSGRRWRLLCLTCQVATLSMLPRSASAVDGWLTLTGSARCSRAPEELSSRILDSLAGTQNQELAIDVRLVDERHTTTALIRLTRGSSSSGEKRLQAPTCEDALDAVVAVVALALSSEPREPAALPSDAPAIRDTSGPLQGAAVTSTSEPAHDLRPLEGEELPGASRWRLLVAGGFDMGMLAEPTAVVGAGVAATVGGGEVRALAWYGVPSYREEESISFQSTRADFGAATLDYCHAADRDRWLGICGGLELGLRRLSGVEQPRQEARTEWQELDPTLGGVAALTLVFREAPFMPHIDLAARLPVAGGLAELPAVGFRTAIGAALPF